VVKQVLNWLKKFVITVTSNVSAMYYVPAGDSNNILTVYNSMCCASCAVLKQTS